jgi:dephospho-CoA kinase
MRIIGLTGSIGMGKSVALGLLRRLGLPVHDADAEVHRLLGPNGAAVPAIAEAFPGTVVDGMVDRQALGARVFGNEAALRRLEAIVHPLVRRNTGRWLAGQARRRAAVAVLDIPLLFESTRTGRRRRYDSAIVVSAPGFIQRQRVLRRPGMTPDRFGEINRAQMPDRKKRRLADAVVTSGLGRRPTLLGLKRALRGLRRRGAWRPGYLE